MHTCDLKKVCFRKSSIFKIFKTSSLQEISLRHGARGCQGVPRGRVGQRPPPGGLPDGVLRRRGRARAAVLGHWQPPRPAQRSPQVSDGLAGGSPAPPATACPSPRPWHAPQPPLARGPHGREIRLLANHARDPPRGARGPHARSRRVSGGIEARQIGVIVAFMPRGRHRPLIVMPRPCGGGARGCTARADS